MSKIICDVCGTSYPDTAAQCPICGCACPAESKGVYGDTSVVNKDSGTYQHVRGGRFSKSNVQKRNSAAQASVRNTTASKMSKVNQQKNKSSKGLVATAVVLLLAIIAMLVYISLRFFAPSVLEDPEMNIPAIINPNPQPSETETPQQTTGAKDIACTGISLDVTYMSFDKVGSARMVYATLEPEDTTDMISFSSSDENVATVDDNGKITSIGNGEAIITVTCGEKSATCQVVCFDESLVETTVPTTEVTVPEDQFMLNRSDITFSKKDESWLLYSGNLSKTEIIWSSDDPTVATIENGKVVAVGGGTTQVHGEYNGVKVSCIIRCNFAEDQGVSGSGGVSEDDGGSSGSITEDGSGSVSESGFTLYNPFGSAEDVTIKVGDSFSLQLHDNTGNPVEATWAVGDTECCSADGNTFTGVAPGTTSVTATYDGEVYTCVVRVK